MKTSVRIGAVVVLLFVIALILAPTISWIGGAPATITVRVLDDESELPVSGAEVSFLQERERQALATFSSQEARIFRASSKGVATTDATGTCVVMKVCGAGGGEFLFWRTGTIKIQGPIFIRAEGYEAMEIQIQNALGKKRFPLRKKSQSITLYLRKREPIPEVSPPRSAE